MTCRHSGNDPSCSSHRDYVAPWTPPSTPATPDPSNYTIEDVVQVHNHLVVKARYPNCSNCAFEGTKIMVFLNVTPIQAMRWRKIDPHFRNPKKSCLPHEAPPPAARFPGTEVGFKDAIDYASSKK